MGKILNQRNLKAYLKKEPFPVASMLYDRLPVLAVRNYLNDYPDEDEWPLVWRRGRGMRIALSATIEVLKGWQAFRPGSAAAIEKRLRERVPSIVLRMQRSLRDLEVYRITDVKRRTTASKVLVAMARAVADVSACKGTENPMFGSKVMNFFFPEFFPVWDTAWVRKKVFGKLSRLERRALREAAKESLREGPGSRAAMQYAAYVQLMINDLRLTRRRQYEDLRGMCLRHCAREKSHKLLGQVIEDNLWDMSPLLFELCLLGGGVKAVRAAIGAH